MRLMAEIRLNIEQDSYPKFVQSFMFLFYKQREDKRTLAPDASNEDWSKELNENGYPIWIANVMAHLKIDLL